MEWKDYFNNVLKGVVGAVAVTTILTAIYSLIMNFVDFSSGIDSAINVTLTSISLIFGTILAAKLYGRKGWLVGLSVGVLFYIALYAIGVLFGAEATLGLYDLIKFSLCALVGILSGMLGINLGRD
ncbi:TIGR04086 family membrane protein [Clostridium sp. D53t1_180928_C8]|uniref:TIGR04086 family membrane protein n=1 Tax=Clostridium sp. D53t1_180928_C8 TaxID=2787101 RepID=UPI0018AB1E3A|nr:TIGR04086 family membrane protein [Clostridium sp. D53t1_180928_C8]